PPPALPPRCRPTAHPTTARPRGVRGATGASVVVVGNLIDIADIRAAAERIAPHVLRTPPSPSPGLTAHLGVPVTLKLELLQRSGSFKARGAFAKILSLRAMGRGGGGVGG